MPIEAGPLIRYGTVDWVFREYKASKAYLEKVAVRSRPDYERTMLMVCDVVTKRGDRIGSHSVRSITPRAADKLYDRLIHGKRGLRLRQGEKARLGMWSTGSIPMSSTRRCQTSEHLFRMARRIAFRMR
jgi:hypothetical protein